MTYTQCPVTFASRILGGRWSAKIIWSLLRHGTLRYSEIRRACPPISDRILSRELKALEEWGILTRYDHATIPPHTDYSLTELGKTLRPLMEEMASWGARTQDRLLEASKTARRPGGLADT